MNNFISVIVPAYNVETYIGKCLDSILSQTYRDLEVIVIDDGSTDNTSNIIAHYAGDSRLKYVEQKNSGVSAARNAGISAATGDYLAFVDSDDYLEPDMYKKLLAALIESQADIAVCNYNLIYEGHTVDKYSNMKDEIINVSENVQAHFYKYCACPKPNNYIWTRLYRTNAVKTSGVRFEHFKLGDDTLFNFKFLPYIKQAVHISSGFYNYLQRSNSNVYTVAKHGNLAEVYADVFAELTRHYKSLKFESSDKILPIHAYTRLRSTMFYSRLAGISGNEIAESIATGFSGKEIANYLRDVSYVDDYAKINGFSEKQAKSIKRIMRIALENPYELAEMEIE
jgi:glycosyltransferase involved in cell wall biosynthesis